MTELKSEKRGCRYWRNLGLFAVLTGLGGLLLLIYVGHPYYLSRGWSRPRRLALCCATPDDYGMEYEAVSFETGDGLNLRGWYVPSRNRAAVILSHPMASNRVVMLEVAEVLARHGYGVLLFDLRAHGESNGDVLPFGGNEREDVRGAAAYLQTRADVDPDRIGAMGMSLGAQVSILGAAGTPTIRAVVADAPCYTRAKDFAPPSNLGDWLLVPYDLIFFQMLQWHTGVPDPESIQEAVAKISPRPIFFVGGGSEQSMLEHHFRAAGEPKELWIIPEAGHTAGLDVRPEEYEERIVGFFDEALLGKE